MRLAVGCAVCALVLVVPAAVGGASPGWLDPAFGVHGVARPTFGISDSPARVAVQNNGRIVVVASSSSRGSAGSSHGPADFAVARFLRSGKLDSSFGASGKVLVDVGSLTHDEASAVAVQPDGKIVVGGWTKEQAPPYNRELALVRLDPDGALDPTFGNAGRVVTDLGASARISDLALQADGKIVGAGLRGDAIYDILVARYASDGTLDPTFDHDGWLTTQLPYAPNAVAHAIAIQADGAIVVGGAGGSYGEPGISSFQALFTRYLPSGALDPSFGREGRVLLASRENAGVADILLQPDGRIVGVGWSGSTFEVVRLTSGGSLDPTFGKGGKVLTGFTGNPRDSAASVVRRSDGRLVVGGDHRISSGDFALAQYRVDGSLDKRFGEGGRLLTDLGGDEGVVGLALQSDGKLLAVGPDNRQDHSGTGIGIVLVRYLQPIVCTVPGVLHRSLGRARRTLKRAGCRTGLVAKRRSKQRAGVVIAQRPSAGAKTRGAVSLVVSRGR